MHFFVGCRSLALTSIITGGTDGILRLWKTPNKTVEHSLKRKNKLIWSLKPLTSKHRETESLSEIVSFPSGVTDETSGLILVAGDMGSISLLDIHKCSRTAFSVSTTPQVLMTFHLSNFRGLRRCKLPSDKWMGVKRAFILTTRLNEFNAQNCDRAKFENETKAIKQVDLAIVTNCGWVMLLYVDLHLKSDWEVNSSKLKLLHRGDDVLFRTANFEEIDGTWDAPVSLPQISTPTDCLHGSSLVCVADVKSVCQVLPNKDKRIVDSFSQVNCDECIVSGKSQQTDRIVIMDTRSRVIDEGIVSKIVLPNGPAHQLCIDPGNRWIVVSTNLTITLFH